MSKTLIVAGGGAAGFFCAVNAARLDPSLKVAIIEKTGKLLSKVRVSGGGRCNVTHACFDPAEMPDRYPRGSRFVKKSFHLFFTTDTINWFAERGVTLKTESDGRMFPVSDTSQTIIDCLLAEARKYNVNVKTNTEVKQVAHTGGKWQIELVSGARTEQITANYLCIACGGYPRASMFDWLVKLGHTIETPLPSLFTFNLPGNPLTKLMGISVADVQVKITDTKFTERGPVLITHWGLSGPAILRLSAWGARALAALDYQFTVLINWLPAFNEQQFRDRLGIMRMENASQKIVAKNCFGLPQRLWEYIVYQSRITEDKRWAELTSVEQNSLVKNLLMHQFQVKGKTTFKEEFVTAGGIALKEINPATMQSRIIPGLFFAGEIMDVDGITGGYNFQHAWTSGFIAANAIANAAQQVEEKS